MGACFIDRQAKGVFFAALCAFSRARHNLSGVFGGFNAAKPQAFLNDFAYAASLSRRSFLERPVQVVIKRYSQPGHACLQILGVLYASH
jgi:hypothetical protein